MRRYELIDGKHQKFWEIGRAGQRITRRWGRLGTKGQEQVKDFESELKARRAHDDLIEKKLGGGYQLVTGAALVSLDEGDEEPARNPELEALIAENPDERDGFLVLGDWLQDQGCPRGELISTHAQMVDQNDPVHFLRFKKIQDRLIAEHPRVFVGTAPLRACMDVVRPSWHLGYWRKVELRGRFEGLPLSLPDIAAALASSPSAIFLRELHVTAHTPPGTASWLTGLARQELPMLHRLEVRGNELSDMQLLAKACSNLRKLKVSATHLSDDGQPWTMASLASLHLDCREVSGAVLRGILDGLASPALQEVHLGSASADQVLGLAKSRATESLQDLRLGGWDLEELTLQVLIDHRDRFTHLKSLELCVSVPEEGPDAALHREFAERYEFAQLETSVQERYDETGE